MSIAPSDAFAIPIVAVIFLVILVIVLGLIKGIKAIFKRLTPSSSYEIDLGIEPFNPLMTRPEDTLLSQSAISGLASAPKKTVTLPRAPGSLFALSLEYHEQSEIYWMGVWELIWIIVYGNADGPQANRLPVVQKVIQALALIDIRARTELTRQFKIGSEYKLLAIYFGEDGDEPLDEFSVRFGTGRTNRRTEYYVRYRLNREHPDLSTLIDSGLNSDFLIT